MERFLKIMIGVTGGFILWRSQYYFSINDYYTAFSILNFYLLGLVLSCYAETIGSEIKYKNNI